MNYAMLIAGGLPVLGAAAAVLIGGARERAKEKELLWQTLQSVSRPLASTVGTDSLSELPSPVARYFRYVLADGQRLIRTARMRQSGVLRTSLKSDAWSAFTADHFILPDRPAFIWNARVQMPLKTHVRVIDCYANGLASGRVSFLSALTVASDKAAVELNSGALHRYLAEAVWFPTALLPQSGVVWSSIDDHSALATTTDRSTTVSLEFRFNEIGEVTGVYTPKRFGKVDHGFKQMPWEGRFRDYGVIGGIRVPRYGEVGWYEDGSLELIWKGNVLGAEYEFR